MEGGGIGENGGWRGVLVCVILGSWRSQNKVFWDLSHDGCGWGGWVDWYGLLIVFGGWEGKGVRGSSAVVDGQWTDSPIISQMAFGLSLFFFSAALLFFSETKTNPLTHTTHFKFKKTRERGERERFRARICLLVPTSLTFLPCRR